MITKSERIIIGNRLLQEQIRKNNRGYGAGGKNTNRNGLQYQNRICQVLLSNISNKVKHQTKKWEYYQKDNILYFEKNNLTNYMKNKSKYKRYPDFAVLDQTNKKLNLFEVKFQQCSGSVDEKLQTGGYKLHFFSQLYKDYQVSYHYVVNDFFRDDKYTEVIKYNQSLGIQTFWGDDIFNQNFQGLGTWVFGMYGSTT